MRVLVYGFGPYKEFKSNITQKIVRKLPRSADLKKIVFPVRFDRAQFVNAIEKHRPDVILGLGQCGSGKRLRIERCAVNRRRDTKEEKSRPIRRGGPRSLAPTLSLEEMTSAGRAVTSSNAGDYVCNFSMYIMLDYLKRRRRKARFGFVHIPHDCDRARAERFVRKLIAAVRFKSWELAAAAPRRTFPASCG
jgi:pyroglutamyl-peptidase